jgi:hypothetical protein
MEVVLEKEVSPQNEYNWRLAKALLERIEVETTKLGAQLVVLGIPYLPQVYDETWQSTFGDNPKYAREAGTNRLREWLQSRQIPTLIRWMLCAHVRRRDNGSHHRKDAHPTAEDVKSSPAFRRERTVRSRSSSRDTVLGCGSLPR